MARFRRRRFNGLWFPTNSGSVSFDTNVPVAANGDTTLNVFQLVQGDTWANSSTATTTDAGFTVLATRAGYIAKRIVGELHLGHQQKDPGTHTGVLITDVRAGLFVDRCDQDGVLQNLEAWDPFQEYSTQKRWLWRRNWLLQNSAANTPAVQAGGSYDFPNSNAEYNGALSNGHIDWKGGARVTYEEKLFLMVGTTALWILSGGDNLDSNICVNWNLRVLAKPTQRNNR